MTITLDEFIKAVQDAEAPQAGDFTGYTPSYTMKELISMFGFSKDKILRFIHELNDKGMVKINTGYSKNICGVRSPTVLYRFKLENSDESKG